MNCLAEVVGIDGVLGLFVDIFAGQLRSDQLSGSRGRLIAIGDIEAVCDVVTTGVNFDFDVLTHIVDDDFHRLAAQSFGLGRYHIFAPAARANCGW